jgi:hypothetical protein
MARSSSVFGLTVLPDEDAPLAREDIWRYFDGEAADEEVAPSLSLPSSPARAASSASTRGSPHLPPAASPDALRPASPASPAPVFASLTAYRHAVQRGDLPDHLASPQQRGLRAAPDFALTAAAAPRALASALDSARRSEAGDDTATMTQALATSQRLPVVRAASPLRSARLRGLSPSPPRARSSRAATSPGSPSLAAALRMSPSPEKLRSIGKAGEFQKFFPDFKLVDTDDEAVQTVKTAVEEQLHIPPPSAVDTALSASRLPPRSENNLRQLFASGNVPVRVQEALDAVMKSRDIASLQNPEMTASTASLRDTHPTTTPSVSASSLNQQKLHSMHASKKSQNLLERERKYKVRKDEKFLKMMKKTLMKS